MEITVASPWPNRPGPMFLQLESALSHITLAWKGRGNPLYSSLQLVALISEALTGSSNGDWGLFTTETKKDLIEFCHCLVGELTVRLT